MSPCTKNCQLDDEKINCIMCGRTVHEIMSWRWLTDDEKSAIMNQLKDRMLNVKKET